LCPRHRGRSRSPDTERRKSDPVAEWLCCEGRNCEGRRGRYIGGSRALQHSRSMRVLAERGEGGVGGPECLAEGSALESSGRKRGSCAFGERRRDVDKRTNVLELCGRQRRDSPVIAGELALHQDDPVARACVHWAEALNVPRMGECWVAAHRKVEANLFAGQELCGRAVVNIVEVQ